MRRVASGVVLGTVLVVGIFAAAGTGDFAEPTQRWTPASLPVAYSDPPIHPLFPAPDRVADIGGQLVVMDEIVIGVDRALADPDAFARDVAVQTGGVVIGAVPETRTYQVRYAGIYGPDDLRSRIFELMSRHPDLVFASRHFLSRALVRIPDDHEYSQWEKVAAGNNWALEYIRVPEAWDQTSGAARTLVVVIDGGFDPDHRDLVANVVGFDGVSEQANVLNSHQSASLWDGHGTHVVGTICAEGNNGVGVSRVARTAGCCCQNSKQDVCREADPSIQARYSLNSEWCVLP